MRTNCIITGTCMVALAACGGGGGGSTGPVDATVNGSWTGTVTNVTGSGVTCNMTGVVMNLAQADTTFTGSYTVTHLTCVGPGGTQNGGPFAGTIANGTIVNANVAFDMDTPEIHFTGTKSGNRLTGSTVWTLDLGPPTGVVVLTGSWTASR